MQEEGEGGWWGGAAAAGGSFPLMEGREEGRSNICIYSNQSVNSVHEADKGRPMGGLRPAAA